MLQEVAKCQATDARLTLSDVCKTYARLKKQCREEYVMYNLAAAALAQVSLAPLLAHTTSDDLLKLLSTMHVYAASLPAALGVLVI